ncbi:uncharacterized protein LOC119078313 [Bradysia coprophila]|uniref:uncharacterized protein LOC119078313 n=1 Tax=Bradysia coprophila TaxID=38358 RepID=UPI00187DC16F|nr:uncharacterized protein LOC119078313 [Bradysia coprophila]
MSSNNYAEQANRILSSENLQNVGTIEQELIDRNLLHESERFLSFDRHSVAFKQTKVETTEQIDGRVKKCNELRERLKKFTKTMRKSFPQADRHCDKHQNANPIEVAELLNKLNEKEVPMPDLVNVLQADEAVFQQHKSNIEKVNKLMETVKGYECAIKTLPAVGMISETVTLLQEIINDVDYLNESETMYAGLSKQAPCYLYDQEVKDLSNHLYMQ